MPSAERMVDKENRVHNLMWIVTGYSLLFWGVLSLGYYHLFLSTPLLAWALAIILPSIAWSIGKFIGSSEHGIRGQIPLFILLLLMSAVGVFNALMLQLEGKKIFQEAIDSARGRFTQLRTTADQLLTNEEVAKKIANIRAAKSAYIDEINNDRNCGEGQRALEDLVKLRALLPSFQPLSGKTDCSTAHGREQLRSVTDSYDKQIEDLVTKTDWYIKANYGELVKTRFEIDKSAPATQSHLQDLDAAIVDGSSSIADSRRTLEESNVEYQRLVGELRQFASAAKVPPELDLASIRNLGEWSQIINLLLSRLDKPQTYVYLFMAVFADWMLVHLFTLLRQHRRALPPPAPVPPATAIRNPFN